MKHFLKTVVAALLLCSIRLQPAAAQITIGQCLEMAKANYPQVRQLGLIEEAARYDIAVPRGGNGKICAYCFYYTVFCAKSKRVFPFFRALYRTARLIQFILCLLSFHHGKNFSGFISENRDTGKKNRR